MFIPAARRSEKKQVCWRWAAISRGPLWVDAGTGSEAFSVLNKWRDIVCLGLVFGLCLLVAGNPAFSDDIPDMVFFPEGEFMMGSPEDEGLRDEHPRHPVYLDAFYLDKFEATGKDFLEFLQSNPREHPTITGWYGREPRPDMMNRPVIGLTWKRCKKYCEWRGKRMPTEAEWERAASGLEGRLFPWGRELPDETRANFNRCCFINKGQVLEDADSLPLGRTPEGIFHMAGNIAEWVHDWYDPTYYRNSAYRNPQGPGSGRYHVIRGGAWNSLPDYLRSKRRYGNNDGQDFYGIGCRCARSMKGVPEEPATPSKP